MKGWQIGKGRMDSMGWRYSLDRITEERVS